MNGMPGIAGNPYGFTADCAATQDVRVLTEAVLALAYEQRTANIIALMHHAAGFSHGGGFAELYAEAANRLGQTGEDA